MVRVRVRVRVSVSVRFRFRVRVSARVLRVMFKTTNQHRCSSKRKHSLH